ncbi:hypothetical protein [Streptomyces sp. AcE210]|uniref:hypothetical protein n=1 Tax=Streptomyces sp. AcE210 TaxID=2292703 RepID=UPI000E302E47|nr:hypothetical protein [Streptomyces sp. AcE210]RFC73314.1 hypothetical protein DXZ75_41640 [Streptomyces sp. AcE210]
MTPRLRTTGRPLPPLLRPLLILALLSGPAVTGPSAHAAEPPPTRAPASADDEPQAGSHPGEGRTPPGRAESKPPDHDRPKEPPPKHPPRHEPSTAAASAPDTGKPSASASPRRPSASPARPKASSADPSRKGYSARKSHSASASGAADAPKRSHAPSADPSRTRSAHAAIPMPPEEPQAWEEDPAEQQVQPSARPTSTPADNAGRTPRQTVAEPVIPGVGVLPLGSGLILVGLGVGFLALRLRRT